MAKPDGRIEKGQRLSTAISARAWNRAQDAADIVLGVRPGVQAEGFRGNERPYNWMYVLNGAGLAEHDIPRWGPVVIVGDSGRSTHVDNDIGTFMDDSPVLVGYSPTTAQGQQNEPYFPHFWGIATEPIAYQTIGKVAVSGIVPCRINVQNEQHTYATIFGADGQELRTSRNGGAVIVHKDVGTGAGKRGLIQLGHQQAMRRAKITTTWQINEGRELTDDDGRTFTANNYVQTLTLPVSFTGVTGFTVLSERWVYCAEVNGAWHLISWESGLATPASLPQTTAIVPV